MYTSSSSSIYMHTSALPSVPRPRLRFLHLDAAHHYY